MARALGFQTGISAFVRTPLLAYQTIAAPFEAVNFATVIVQN